MPPAQAGPIRSFCSSREAEVLPPWLLRIYRSLPGMAVGFDGQEEWLIPGDAGSTGEVTLRVDGRKKAQAIEGFGASLTEASVIQILKLEPAAQRELLQRLFSKENGFGLDLLRVPMGASDFTDPKRGFYSYNDTPGNRPDPELRHFDVTRDEKTFALLKRIRDINPDIKLMLTPWSAPAWMKANGDLTGKTGSNRLDPRHYGAYARYFQKTLQEYKKRGLDVHSLILQNEPGYDDAPYPSMGMTPKEQARLIGEHIGPMLQKTRSKAKVLVLDHNWNMQDWAEEVLQDQKARPHIGGVAYHCYDGEVDAVGKTYQESKVPVYQTECTGTGAPDGGDLGWWLETQVIGAGNMGGASGMGWNLALDEKGGPYLNANCENCRGLVTIDSSTGKVTVNPELTALGLAAKFTGPGTYRIESSSSDPELRQVAYLNRDGSRALVLHNRSSVAKSVRLTDEKCRDIHLRVPPGKAMSLRW
ncbi:MAG: glycosyl hydrolase [Oligoflexia bacterium]|nr:glycosyl hydrolase [Oligoflexia bacterium]